MNAGPGAATSATPSSCVSAPSPLRRSRYFAWLYTPRDGRDALAALFGIEDELTRSVGLEHTVAHARAAWWQDELDRLALGVPRHPLTRALLERSRQLGARPPALARIMQNVRWDLAAAAPLSREDLDVYASHWAQSVFRAALALTIGDRHGEADTEKLDTFVQHAGSSLCELEQLARLDEDARAGLVRWPIDELDALDLRHDVLTARPFPAALSTALVTRVDTLSSRIAHATGALPSASVAPARGLAVWLTLATRHARRVLAAVGGMHNDRRSVASGSLREAIGDVHASWQTARRALRTRSSHRNPA